MGAVTIAVAVVASLLVMATKPRHGLGIYFALLMLYPSYLSVSLGSVDITVSRIVVTVLLLRVLTDRELAVAFRFKVMDFLVLALFAWGAFALTVTVGAGILENRAGAFMNTVMPYFAARLIVKSRDDLLCFAKWVAVVVIPVAALAVLESATGWSMYLGMKQYSYLGMASGISDQRWGFYRAAGPSMAITFGLCFVAVMPMILSLRKCTDSWKSVSTLSLLAAVGGVLASMSSGPLMCLVVFSGCAVLIYRPAYVKPIIVLFLLALVAAEIGSNRHFYYLIGYLTFSEKTAWYRAKLFEVAVRKLPEYWLLGYGGQDPGWGPLIDERNYTDVCNGYILFAVTQGIPAMLLFSGVLATGIAYMTKVYRTSVLPLLKDAAWYMGSFMVGMIFALWSVGLLGSMEMVFYIVVGVMAAPVFDMDRFGRAALSVPVSRSLK